MRFELFPTNLELAKTQVRCLFVADLSTVKQFAINDGLAGIDTLLLVPNLPYANKYAHHALKYKIQNLREIYQASTTN